MEHTTDGGRSWSSMPAPRAHIASSWERCNSPCVTSIRFATSRIGYAFGDTDPGNTLFMTLDGGRTWRAQRGNAVRLEAANGTAIRVRARQGGCPGPCVSAVQTGPVGGTTWASRLSAPFNIPEADVEFARHGAQAYLLFEDNPAGGAQRASSVQYRSTDGGRHWNRDGELYAQGGRGLNAEIDSSRPSVGPDGTYVLTCFSRSGKRSFLLRSTDHGRSYHRGPSVQFGSDEWANAVGPVSAHVTVVSTNRATYRSTGGAFTRLAGLGALRWIGFSSSSIGHAISADGRRIWRTSDGGRT